MKEAVHEVLLEEILQEDILPGVLDEEMRHVALLELSEHASKVYEQQLGEVRGDGDGDGSFAYIIIIVIY